MAAASGKSHSPDADAPASGAVVQSKKKRPIIHNVMRNLRFISYLVCELRIVLKRTVTS
jgi:hypothetical protein